MLGSIPSARVDSGGPNGMERGAKHREGPRAVAPSLAQSGHGACRVGRGRRGDHEHRWSRLARHALAILARADGRKTAHALRGSTKSLRASYQSRSTLLTSQLPVASWHPQIGDPTLADSILDRLVHNAHRIELQGESMRRKRGPKAGKENV